MIPKPIDQITEADLSDLVSASVAERKTLDYKQQLPDTNDAGKRELLADVSSFANTAGGDLVFGMTESAGVPTAIPGVQIGNTDQEILRFDNIIRDGLSPRIRHTTRAVPLTNGGYVLIIRSERSWYGPHRVIFKGDSRFYGRTTNGKYELDVTDLRNAFLFASAVTEKISAFRAERVIALENGQPLAPLAEGPKLVIHCMALESFGARPQYDVLALDGIQPMYATRLSGWGARINFEGRIFIASGEPSSAYTQIYRNGVIEAVRVGVLNSPQSPGVIPSLAYEEAVVGYLPQCFQIMRQLGCSPPVLVGITLIGVRGLKLAVDVMVELSMGGAKAIDRDVLMLPEIVVEDLSTPAAPLLKRTLDLVWNACGFPSSPYFDAAGKWMGRTR
ncbi:MAG TPA: ATP-binding protein [Bryobacteraceae bacterium]|nr:ATP-binding protein [Bryobacteraceae bacterium]